MKVRVVVTVDLTSNSIKAFLRYNNRAADEMTRAELRARIAGTVDSVGRMGLGEQIAEGNEWLEADERAKDEK